MFRNRVTFANVTSFVALFVALSAGSYAAVSLPSNSVGTKQIKSKAVTNAKLARDAIDGSKVKNGSLLGADINLTTLGKVPSAASADTAAAAPIARVKTVSGSGTSQPAIGSPPVDVASATCDGGLVVVGGGVQLGDPSTQEVIDSFPNGSSTWSGHVANFGTGTPTFTVYALCAPAASTQ
jgi:hypothetical protein